EVIEYRSGGTPRVTLRYISPNGEQGYPGTLVVDAIYSLNEANELTIEYRAMTDRPTIVNITNHTYWNLAGEYASDGAIDHSLMIPAEMYTPIDAELIPTGELRKV